MKVNKKNILLLGMAILSGSAITAFQEWEPQYPEYPERGFQAGYPRMEKWPLGTRVGQSKAEIKKEFKDATTLLFTDPGDWSLVLDDVYKYVEENAHGNTKLMTTAHLVKEVGTLLSMSIHQATSIPAKWEEKLQEKANILEATTFYTNRKDKYNAKEVLMEVINFLLPHIGMLAG